MRRLSAEGYTEIKRLEGVRSDVYRDEAGLPTVGVGHLLTTAELGLRRDATPDQIEAAARARWPHGLSPTQIDELLARDLATYETAVSKAVRVPLGQPQFDALVIFAFNIGTAAFASSSLVRTLNAGDYAGVPAQLARWNKVRDPQTRELRPSPGLTKRRLAEAAMWNRVPAPTSDGKAVTP